MFKRFFEDVAQTARAAAASVTGGVQQSIAEKVVQSVKRKHDLTLDKQRCENQVADYQQLRLEWLDLPRIKPATPVAPAQEYKLAGLHIYNADESDKPGYNPSCIIYLRGNGDFAQTAMNGAEMTSDALRLPGVHTVSLNYTGVTAGGSTGTLTHYDDMTADAVAIVNYMMEKYNIPAERIILKGQSLGGAVSTLAAAELTLYDLHTKVASMRSFWDIGQVPFLTTENPFLGFFARHGMSTANWRMTVAHAWDALPAAQKFFLSSVSDPIIGDDNSLYENVPERKDLLRQKTYFEQQLKTATADTHASMQQLYEQACDDLDTFEEQHLVRLNYDVYVDEIREIQAPSHNAPLHCLVNKKGVSADDLFIGWAAKVLNIPNAILDKVDMPAKRHASGFESTSTSTTSTQR